MNNIYKEAIASKLKFTTSRGVLSVEQVYHLSLLDLKATIIEQSKLISNNVSNNTDFLDDINVVDSTENLKFEILKDIYLTKKEVAEQKRTALENKEFNAKIDALIAEKQEGELKNKSIDELLALRK